MSEPESSQGAWRETLARYQRPQVFKSLWQICNTLVPFFGLWYLMYLSLDWSYWVTLLLAVPTAGFLVRIFIIQHDCGHHSFFRNHALNDVLGCFCGVLTFTPYFLWRRTHARHHSTSGDLNHRGYGDIGMLTVNEYLKRSRWGRLRYRLYRNPLFMFLVGATFMFTIEHRFTFGIPAAWRRERASVYGTDLALLAIFAIASWTIGWQALLLVELPVVMIGSTIGCWLFYVQHQYEEAYWQPHSSWDFVRSALEGSSYYRLPAVLQWFTGNIGFHHIHHLNSRIPNYYLPACYADEPALRQVVTLGIRDSIRCASLKLWDEDRQKMVTFADVKSRLGRVTR